MDNNTNDRTSVLLRVLYALAFACRINDEKCANGVFRANNDYFASYSAILTGATTLASAKMSEQRQQPPSCHVKMTLFLICY